MRNSVATAKKVGKVEDGPIEILLPMTEGNRNHNNFINVIMVLIMFGGKCQISFEMAILCII